MNSIYALVDPRDKTVRYVGETTRPLGYRLTSHLYAVWTIARLRVVLNEED